MKKIEFKIIANLVTVFLLCITLIISISYGWYTNNKVVHSNGIHASSSSSNLDVTNQGMFKGEISDNPFPDDKTDEITGILSGEIIYYSVKVKTNDLEDKNIRITFNDIDGGEFLTAPRIHLGTSALKTYDGHDVFTDGTKEFYLTYNDGIFVNYLNETGDAVAETISLGQETDQKYIGDMQYTLYQDNDEKLFYISKKTSVINDVTYTNDVYINYIYEENGKYYNMCDLYFIDIYKVYLSKNYYITEVDGVQKVNYFYYDENDELVVEIEDLTFTAPEPEASTGTITIDNVNYLVYNNPYAVVLDNSGDEDLQIFKRDEDKGKTISKFNVFEFEDWNTRMSSELTFTFIIKFDYEYFAPKINLSSASNKTLHFGNVIISEYDKGE